MTLVSLSEFPCNVPPLESRMKVLLAEDIQQNSSLILESLSALKECAFFTCNDPQELVNIASEMKPDLLLINYDLFPQNGLNILNVLKHQDRNSFLIVYLTAALEETRNAILMAGASECLVISPDDLHTLSGHVKKALITISERECFQQDPPPTIEEIPEIVFSLDLEGHIVFVNFAVTQI